VAVKPKEQSGIESQKDGTVEVRRGVIDLNGKPFPAAKVYFLARHRIMQTGKTVLQTVLRA
jgi:hypothetical protein